MEVNLQIDEFDPSETTLARHTANVKLQIDAAAELPTDVAGGRPARTGPRRLPPLHLREVGHHASPVLGGELGVDPILSVGVSRGFRREVPPADVDRAPSVVDGLAPDARQASVDVGPSPARASRG